MPQQLRTLVATVAILGILIAIVPIMPSLIADV